MPSQNPFPLADDLGWVERLVAKKRRQRFLQRLRTLVLLVIVVAILVALAALIMQGVTL